MGNPKLAITCDNEVRRLSNEHSSDIWDAFDLVFEILLRQSNFASHETLFAWKQVHHLATAREPYAWRAALDELKNSDLTAACMEYKGREFFVLMTDKPTMLKIGGEITNS